MGQRPEAAVRPIVGIIDDPRPGWAVYRGAGELAIDVGDRAAQDAARLAAAVEPD
ncbi:hypothetical protein [Actinophytocola gossypii]|uniref:Uncharacterized protein n=1 Tax=Actinophytocola gossypii TaxID=2812003 RepID=A0ABT2J9K9_9PSEU|nr:hypothetical protein [Actinophytocola gossypii]MCT2583959.1 hypothetical protein [Actinophytocola gossypii]